MIASSFPLSIDDIDSTWLSEAMRRSGAINPTETITITEIVPVASGTAFAGQLFRLHLDSPTTPTVVLKLPVTGVLRPVLDGIGAYAREITFYRELADDSPIRCARALVAEMAPDSTDFVLVLEDLSNQESGDQLIGISLAQAERTLDALADLHAWSWEHPRLQQYRDRFPALDSPAGQAVGSMYRQAFEASWPNIKKQATGRIADAVIEFGESLPSLLPQMERRLASPRTLVHGELRAENLFFDSDGVPTFIDFQIVQQECGPREVAYLLTQSMTTDARRGHDEGLMRRYWEGLVSRGVGDYPWTRAWEDYRIGVAYNLLYPIMAAARWDEVPGRGQKVLITMIERSAAAIVENDCLAAVQGLDGV